MLRSSFHRFKTVLACNFSTMSRPKENLIKIDGVNVNYLKTGEGEKVVLCLPGALGTIWSDFKPQIEGLSDRLSIVVWDPPGYGKSRPPLRDYEGHFFLKDAQRAEKLMETLGIDRYSILGWSDGGITALIMAGRNKERIEKTVVWGANAYVTENDLKLYEGIRDTSKWSEKMKKPLEEAYGAQGLAKMMSDWCDAMKSYYDKKEGDICREEAKAIDCEVFVLHGDKDPLVPSEHPEFLKKSIKKTRYYNFPDGKHNIHLRYADEFNKLVKEFLLK